jgi:hypothetical protein
MFGRRAEDADRPAKPAPRRKQRVTREAVPAGEATIVRRIWWSLLAFFYADLIVGLSIFVIAVFVELLVGTLVYAYLAWSLEDLLLLGIVWIAVTGPFVWCYGKIVRWAWKFPKELWSNAHRTAETA